MLHQLPAVVFHSGDRLCLAVLRDVQVKAVGAIRKQQHMVSARSTDMAAAAHLRG